MRFRMMMYGALALATPMLAVQTMAAQSTPRAQLASDSRAVDPRWDAWVGCWQAEAAPAAIPGQDSSQLESGMLAPVAPGAPVVCVAPTAEPSTVQVVTVANGKVVGQDSIAVTGEQRPRARQGCTGWESATWSSDGARVYLRSEDACPRGLARTSTGVLAMSPTGEWVDVQGVTVGGHTGLRTVRYRSVAPPAALPPELTAALTAQDRDRAVAVGAARSAAGAPLTDAAIIDASHHLDPSVAEAWVLASGQHMTIDAHRLVALADAGVPGKVTDALVALSYPKEFALGGAPTASASDLSLQNRHAPNASDVIVTGREVPVFIDPYAYAPYGFDAYGYSPYYGYSGYSGFSPYYGYGALSYYGYAPYLGGLIAPYGGWIAPPVIVLNGSNSSGSIAGRAVKGRGYVPNGPLNGTRTAQPRMEPTMPTASQSPPPPPPASAPRTAHSRP